MNQKEYNGWSSYETWCVNLWMDNEEGSQARWHDLAKSALTVAKNSESAYAKWTGKEIFTVEERATLNLSETIKSDYEDAALDRMGETSDVFSDLMTAALSEVNWHEIAKHLIAAVTEGVAK